MKNTFNSSKFPMNPEHKVTNDDRSIFEMYRDAILRSPTGEPIFTSHEQAKVELLEAEEVILEAETILTAAGTAVANCVEVVF